MSNLGFQVVYRLLNEIDGVACERAFLPDREDIGNYEEGKTPLVTLETGRRLIDCDIIAFSVPFENDFPNIVKILDLSGIPIHSSERGDDMPLVVSGGVTAFLNPEPVADFIDCFIIGEGEAVLPAFVTSFIKNQAEGKMAALDSLGTLPGIYIPNNYDVKYAPEGEIASYTAKDGAPKSVRRVWLSLEELEKSRGGSGITAKDTEFGDMSLIEVGRGCGRGCRFCAAGFIYLPPRERKAEVLSTEFDEAISNGKRIGLISPSLADHPDIEGICSYISKEGGSTSISSVRADRLDEGYLSYIKDGGQKTVTIAPEAGTERLRSVINKGLSDEDILGAISTIAREAIPNIRLYFMIGLPSERDDDIQGIIDTAIACRDRFIDESRIHGRVGKLTLSVNSFVPKPFTPFQWHPMEDVKTLKSKLQRITKRLRREANIEVICDAPKLTHVQGLLSRGGRRVGRIVEAVGRNGGKWKAAIKDTGIDPDFYTTRERGEHELFPWEVIDIGLNKDYLGKEYQRGLEGKFTPPCHIGPCTRCGVC
jgi:radical SAM superfamily enzyme YgiQ (UPF0313 family)